MASKVAGRMVKFLRMKPFFFRWLVFLLCLLLRALGVGPSEASGSASYEEHVDEAPSSHETKSSGEAFSADGVAVAEATAHS